MPQKVGKFEFINNRSPPFMAGNFKSVFVHTNDNMYFVRALMFIEFSFLHRGIRELAEHVHFDCSSQSNSAIFYGTIFFFFLENCHLAASPHRGASQQNPYVTKYSSSIRI